MRSRSSSPPTSRRCISRSERGSDGRTAVSVVTRALMARWLEVLAGAGLAPTAVCAAASLLPDNPAHTVVMLDADTLALRQAGASATALPADHIGAALEAALGEAMADANLIFYVSPEDWQRRGAEVEALRRHCASLKVQLLGAGPLPLLTPQLPAGRCINLLSGEFAPQEAAGEGWRRWRPAAVFAGVLFAVHLAGLSLALLQGRGSERALDAQIGALARSALPGDSGQGAVRARVEQRLLAVHGAGASAGLMPALSALAQALGSARGASLQALSYRDGGMDLKLHAADAESLEHINQALRASGWEAELTSGGAAASGYDWRIHLRGGGVPRPR